MLENTTSEAALAAPETTFADLGLAPELLRALNDLGYSKPTPIQAKAIPLVIAGQDIMGGAQTGTGKTAAFTLPILQRILPFASSSPSPARHPVRALILAPTRELALQVYESVAAYSKHTPLRAMCAYGGVDIKPQIAELKKGVEILVATPGRLLDHVESKSVSFNSVQALVLDEADRMLDMGFIPDVTRILKMLPAQRQSLLFSATFSDDIKKLADTMLHNPVLVEVARRNQVSDTITHRVHPVSEWGKRGLLIKLLKSGDIRQCIVFMRTKQGCSRLTRELQRAGIHADAIHGDKSQLERIKALDKQIGELCERSDLAGIVRSIPGFGLTCTSEIVAEIGSMDRFRSEGSLAMYLGMAPLDNSSGKRRGTRHAKQVNIRARSAMMTAMNRHILRVEESERYYRKKRNEGKRHNQAIRSLGRHMVRVMWSMTRDGHFYKNREKNNMVEVVKEAIPA